MKGSNRNLMKNTVLVFLLGTFIGSFINTCAFRIPQRKKIVYDRSGCPRCGHTLGVLDLVPVFSYSCLRGRCRYCHDRISLRYPLVELVTAVLFMAAFLVHGFRPISIVCVVMISILLTAALIDLDYFYIPNKLVVFGIISGILVHLVMGTGSVMEMALGFLTGGFPLAAVYLVSRGGMGAGDVKLSAMLGVFLGWQLTLVALFLSFLSGSTAGVLLIATGEKSRRDAIPFGPFLAFGGIAAFLWGWPIFDWYIGFTWR